MDTALQALVMGLVQGLTEFLPVSSSGHLIIVPGLLGWKDPLIGSLAFSVMLHMGTLLALLVYFRWDLLRLLRAWFASLRERSLGDDPDRRLAWLIFVATIPAVIFGLAIGDLEENPDFRSLGRVAIAFLVGAALLWLAERIGTRTRRISELGFGGALGIGVAQALALVPGISRSGISIAAGLFTGLDRESAARFSFLMAVPVTAGAGLFELRKVAAGESGVRVELLPIAIGFVAAAVSGLFAIAVMLRYLRSHPTTIFIVYRVIVAAIVLVAWFGLWNR